MKLMVLFHCCPVGQSKNYWVHSVKATPMHEDTITRSHLFLPAVHFHAFIFLRNPIESNQAPNIEMQEHSTIFQLGRPDLRTNPPTFSPKAAASLSRYEAH